MTNNTEALEKSRLEAVKDCISTVLNKIDLFINGTASDLKAQKAYIWENKGEKNAMVDSVMQSAYTGEAAVAKRTKLAKLRDSPYFGRIDFELNGNKEAVYIGVYSFADADQRGYNIYDWRAPISSMFYDFELGPASYQSPTGPVIGHIRLKRQYRIRKGVMEFMLENPATIQDEVLQRELSRSSSEKMKNIIATIQRDQNMIIRNESARTLIIQGVAGSGKTSIALHRMAFLLYRFKDVIRSENLLILSPNKVFADYISNVLPELGEDQIPELDMEELALRGFEHKFKFQTFFDQVSLLLESRDKAFAERIRFKASFDFLNKLNQYITYIGNEYFLATDIRIGGHMITARYIREKFESANRLPLLKRPGQVARSIADELRFRYRYEMSTRERNDAKKVIEKMYRLTNIKSIYKDFYSWMQKESFFKPASAGLLEYADVFPMLYLKMRLEGAPVYHQADHLLIDEMQDYTPVQYAVISRLFPCKKTILGDAGQSVNPYSSSSEETLLKAFPDADLIRLNKSYRSTIEITSFAQQISPNQDLVTVERHGKHPVAISHISNAEELHTLISILSDFNQADYKSMAIICKTSQQAVMLKNDLSDAGLQINLLGQHSTKFKEGIIITSAHMAKGLEFDCVIVPFANEDNYNSEIDKRMLYVACTRAMHELSLTFTGNLTRFVNFEPEV